MLGRLLRNGAMLALAASLQLSSAQAEPVVLKFAAFVPDAEQTVVTVFKPFIDAVNKDGEGVVKIEFYPNGALGRSPLQQAQMVLDGVADIAWVVASYTPGRF